MREHRLDNLTEGGHGGVAGAALEHTGHAAAEISSIEMPEVGAGIRVSDSL